MHKHSSHTRGSSIDPPAGNGSTADGDLATGTTPPQGIASEPVVLRDDPAPVRAVRAWRRAGRAEGHRHELHPVRAVAAVAALVALIRFLPGAAAFIAILTVLVVLHEGGHYWVARKVGMRPTEFFVGFGPTLWARTTPGGVRYGVKAVPAGGYVKIPGMGPREEVEASLEPYTYRAASRPKRLAVILAGVAVNFAVAIVIFSGFAMVGPDSTANPVEAVQHGVGTTVEVATGTLDGLGKLVFGADDYAKSLAGGKVPENRMMSPIGGAQIADGLLQSDPSKLLLLTGIFSASLALLNLLPLLPLDGGHALIVVVEAAWARLRRRPTLRIDPNRFAPVAVAVLVLLLAVSASSMYLDILHPLTSN